MAKKENKSAKKENSKNKKSFFQIFFKKNHKKFL